MGNCIIFCAADFHGLAAPLTKDDFVIAADGGLTHVRKLGITPNGIMGDFDSLGYTPEDSTVFPVEKDDTDAMLAVRKGLELGYREFYQGSITPLPIFRRCNFYVITAPLAILSAKITS